MFQSWNFNRDELIKLEDVEFEKQFAVYGSDQVEARYILSTSLMQRILKFKKESGKRIHLGFAQSKIYIAISYDKDLFEPPIFRSILNYDIVKGYFEDLDLAIGLVEDLNLNRRIWSKK